VLRAAEFHQFRSFVFCKLVERYMTWVLLQMSRRIREWKKLENRSTFLKSYEWMYSGTVFWLTVYFKQT